MEFKHYSVLRDETIENLNIRPDGIYVDGTLGGAGHSFLQEQPPVRWTSRAESSYRRT